MDAPDAQNSEQAAAMTVKPPPSGTLETERLLQGLNNPPVSAGTAFELWRRPERDGMHMKRQMHRRTDRIRNVDVREARA